MKKTLAILLALVMILSLATTAFAATNDSITVTGTVAGETYELYKMFDLVVDDEENPAKYTYTVNSEWTAFFTGTGAGAAYVTIEDGAVIAVSDAAALAKAAETYAAGLTAIKTVEATGTSVVFDGLENGYYLITSTLGTAAMIETTPDKSDVTISEKNPTDTIEKEVKEDSTGNYGEENDAQVGDTVEFKSTVTLVKNTTNVKVYDVMDSGLTYTADSVAIAGLTKGTEYTVDEAKATNGGYDFIITFTEEYLATLTGTVELELTYTAVLNENAVVKNSAGVAIVDQYNKTQITYGDEQSVKDQTKTTTHASTVNKYADGVENLAGAVFSLKKNGTVVPLIKIDDTNYRVAKAGETGTTNTFKTVATGDIVIWGLDTDTDYTLEEIEAPDGYNKLADEVKLEVKADNSAKADVLNKSGTELPSTGGIGTTLFYVFGGLMVAGAAILLVTKKRMSVAE